LPACAAQNKPAAPAPITITSTFFNSFPIDYHTSILVLNYKALARSY
jgi:hypothetical protein